MMNEDDPKRKLLHKQVFPEKFWMYSAIALPALLILLLIFGSIYAGTKVKISDESRLEFPAASYVTASEQYPQPMGVTLLDQAYFTKKAVTMLSGDATPDAVRQLVSGTLEELKDGLVVVRPGRFEGGYFQSIYEQKRVELEREIEDLSSQLRGFYRNDFESIRTQLGQKRMQLNAWESFRNLLTNANIRCELGNLPYSNERPAVSLIAGRLEGITRDLRITLRDAAPVLDSAFLTKAGISLDVLEDIDLDQELARWKATVSAAKDRHAQESAGLRREVESRVARQRAVVRNRFYSRWISLLAMAFSTLVVFFCLKRYSEIIRRKGLARTSTFEIYFSTNVTSLVLRWLALIIVFIGMVELWGFLLLQLLLSGSKLPLLPLFNTIAIPVLRPLSVLIQLLGAGGVIASILFSLLAPVALGLLAIFQSWMLLLLSEYACFISNCYHVLYHLARPKDRT